MDTEFSVRRAGSTDVDAILALVKQTLGEGNVPRDVSYWNWKHRKNPFGISPCLVAESNGQIVALRAFMRWSWRSNGDDVRAVRAVDTATHPEWRGKGIFSQLTRALASEMEQEGVSFVFNTPNERSRAGYLRMGWVSLGRTSLWLRPVRPFAALRSLLSGRQPHESNGAPGTGQAPHFPAARTLVDSPELEPILDSLPSDGERLTTRPTAEYLRWRYADVPGFPYFAAWEFDGSRNAAVVFRVKRNGALRELRLCDMMLGSSHQAIALGRQIVREIMREAGCDYAAAMAAHGSQEAHVLAGCGFVPAPRTGPVLTVRALAPRQSSTPDPLRRSSWRLSIGALELF